MPSNPRIAIGHHLERLNQGGTKEVANEQLKQNGECYTLENAIPVLGVNLRWFQRSGLKLDEDLKFSEKVRTSIPIERRSKKTIDRPVFTVFNRKVGGKCIGSYGSLEKWPTIS